MYFLKTDGILFLCGNLIAFFTEKINCHYCCPFISCNYYELISKYLNLNSLENTETFIGKYMEVVIIFFFIIVARQYINNKLL